MNCIMNNVVRFISSKRAAYFPQTQAVPCRYHVRIFPDLPRLQEFIADTTQDMDQREWIWQHYGTLALQLTFLRKAPGGSQCLC